MATIIAEIPAPVRLRSLIVESSADENSPVLLFLHGKGEASPHLGELPKVAFHLSPPFRAAMGALANVIVVAPQAPRLPDDGWNWRDYVRPIGDFIESHFRKRRVLATGFSRGGLGVLQLMSAHPDLVRRWAIVDPQRAENDTEQQALVPPASKRETGWLRFGKGIPKNTPFSEQIAQLLPPENVHFIDMPHGDMALAAFDGDRLGGATSLYEFLGLDYRRAQVHSKL
jgi:pimeloyl-ACP methyl ester carboxylesterase